MTKEKIETEVTKTVSETEETPKKKGGSKILIIVLVIIGLLFLCTIGGVLVVRKFVLDKVDEIDDIVKEAEQWDDANNWEDYSDDDWSWIEDEDLEEEVESDFPKVGNNLENDDLISERFPDDIPLSGGKVISSSFDQWSVVVEISSSSSVEEAYAWYEEAIADTDWIVTSKSRDDDSAKIDFNNGLERRDDNYRSGRVNINFWEWRGNYIDIKVRENY